MIAECTIMILTLLSFSSVEDVSTIISVMSSSIEDIEHYHSVSAGVLLCRGHQNYLYLHNESCLPPKMGTKTYQPIHQDLLDSPGHLAPGQCPTYTRLKRASLPWVKARFAPRTAPLTEGSIGGTAGGPN